VYGGGQAREGRTILNYAATYLDPRLSRMSAAKCGSLSISTLQTRLLHSYLVSFLPVRLLPELGFLGAEF